MTTENQLTRRIDRIKEQIVALGDLRPGNVSEQYNVCGNPTCRCKDDPPQRHGPYHQLHWTRAGKSRTEAVRPERLATIEAQTRNYKKLLALIDEWVDTSIELDRLRRGPQRPGPRTRQP